MKLSYILKVLIFVFLIISLLSFINFIMLNLNEQKTEFEGLEMLSKSIPMSKSQAFCDANKGTSGSLEKLCGRLTNGNCNDTSCCVWTSDKKCTAGNIDGPTFNTNSKGKSKELDYYYFKGNCYGNKCPN